MKDNIKKIPVSVLLMFVAAIGLLVFSTVGISKAAPSITSTEYDAQMSMYNIGVQLNENGVELNKRVYENGAFVYDPQEYKQMNILGEDTKFIVGKKYPEVLTVKNNGTIDEYVRVEIRKYWTTDNSAEDNTKKQHKRNPSLIKLELDDSWVLNTKESTTERTVLYYPNILKADPENPANGAETPAFLKSITIDNAIKTFAVQSETEREEEVDGEKIKVKTVTTTYTYNDLNFVIEVRVDAVQTHNAAAAIKSAWGQQVTVGSDGTLSFN